MTHRTWAIVLAGGSGTRLAAECHRLYGYMRPKQFCDFDGRGTLLARTIHRVERLVAEDHVVVITTRGWGPEADEALEGFPRVVRVEQPRAIDTTAGIALPLLHVLERDPEGLVVMLPSDHDVKDTEAFGHAVVEALEVARRHPRSLVLVGARLDAAQEGLGWVVPTASSEGGYRGVASFHEKPPEAEAERLHRDGALVNTFVIAGTALAFAEALARHVPGHWSVLLAAYGDEELLESAYQVLPRSNFSHDVLEREREGLYVVELPPCGWSDVGTPERLRATLPPLDRVRQPTP